MAKKLSKAADRTADGIPRCPKCGGVSFKAKRSMKGKMTVGIAAPKSRVKCETCGEVFKRG